VVDLGAGLGLGGPLLRSEAEPPSTLEAEAGRVDVFLTELDVDEADRVALAETLSAEEAARAARFLSPVHGRRFTAARGFLRGVLARHLGCPPAELRFEYGPRGKPSLPGTRLHFNLSHSGDLALLGVTLGTRLGVDVERVRELDHLRIARRFFAPAEADRLALLPEQRARHAFFAGWTRKEALIKAIGAGLSLPLDGFEVSLEGEATLLRADPGLGAAWALRDIEAPAGFVAATAVEGPIRALRRFVCRASDLL
jgi:4'-phosphopantetheinyl transferase